MNTAAAFDALGDARRRTILAALAGGERTAGELVEAVQAEFPISQPAVSQHLKVLTTAGLVTARREGTRRYYALDPDALQRAQAWLARLIDPMAAFTQPLDALATEVARGKRPRREPSRQHTTKRSRTA